MPQFWDIELGQIFVARFVFGFVTRRMWFTRVVIYRLLISRNVRTRSPLRPGAKMHAAPRGVCVLSG